MKLRNEQMLAMCNLKGKGLEIGPRDNPIVPKYKGYNIETLDHTDKKGLQEKYALYSHIDVDAIEEVDHVWQGGSYVDTIKSSSCYDYIIASHVIEHTVCIISFIKDCMELLKPNGILSLAVPDKRFCFDHFRPLTSIAEVINCYNNSNKKSHNIGILYETYLNYATISVEQELPTLMNTPIQVRNMFDNESFKFANEYIDIHHWVFTKSSFELLVLDLLSLGFLQDMRIVQLSDSNGYEFLVSIQKSSKQTLEFDITKRLKLLNKTKGELAGLDIIEFYKKYASCYIYGAGKRASCIAAILNEYKVYFQGFLVSNGESKPDLYMSKPVYYLSEINLDFSNIGVFLGVGVKSAAEILPFLIKNGIKNVYGYGGIK